MNLFGWNFPSNNYTGENGIGNSGVETFQGEPIKSLAREICQNSLDAGTSSPVRVVFSVYTLPTELIPGNEDLFKVFHQCAEYWAERKSERTMYFFRKALDFLKQDSIRVMRVSDFNTKGLKGSEKTIDSDWNNLIKSSGVSEKPGEAGGSFGIGKFASFACSYLRTVFYSTYDIDKIEAHQGVALLTSFKNENGETTQGIGFYGIKERNMPIYESLSLDPLYERGNCSGTDIFVLGFRFPEWKEDIIASVLDGFLYAIWDRRLEVEVQDTIINKSSLDNLMKEYDNILNEYTKNYYHVLMSSETDWIEEDIAGKGTAKLKLAISSDFVRKVGMFRKTGMKIEDKGHISGHIPFSGVFVAEGEMLNAFLRNLENPQHTKWEINRYDGEPGEAKKLLAKITRFIKDSLNKHVKETGIEKLDAEGVGAYLPDDMDTTEKGKNENKGQSESIENISVKKLGHQTNKKEEKSNITALGLYEENSSGNELDDEFFDDGNNGSAGSKEKNRSRDTNTGSEFDGDNSHKLRKEIEFSDLRLIAKDRENGKYIVVFTPKLSTDSLSIKIQASGEMKREPITVINAENMEKPNNLIVLNQSRMKSIKVEKEQRARIQFQVDRKLYAAMEVELYEN